MGQILLEDKIGALSHSSGVITLADSRLSIGGQQYITSSLNRTISTDVTITANTLYMIFAIVSGGTVSLRVSTNVNSIGPSGFTAWKLVGAFMSSGEASPAFGSFLTIKGVPRSGRIPYSPTYSASLGPATNLDTDYSITGSKISMLLRFVTNGVSAALATATLPAPYAGTQVKIIGNGWAGNEAEAKFVYGDNSGPSVLKFGEVNAGNAFGTFQNANAIFSSTNNVSIVIEYNSTLSETPIEDR